MKRLWSDAVPYSIDNVKPKQNAFTLMMEAQKKYQKREREKLPERNAFDVMRESSIKLHSFKSSCTCKVCIEFYRY